MNLSVTDVPEAHRVPFMVRAFASRIRGGARFGRLRIAFASLEIPEVWSLPERPGVTVELGFEDFGKVPS
jgi:hypothetical protein